VLFAFVLSGQYMHWMLGHLREMPDVPRLLYRSAHIYLLFSGLLNLCVGLYFQARETPVSRALQVLGSFLVMVSPILFGMSFGMESAGPSIERHLLRLGIYASFGGILMHTLAALAARAGVSSSPSKSRV
jgi:hypothetical protein